MGFQGTQCHGLCQELPVGLVAEARTHHLSVWKNWSNDLQLGFQVSTECDTVLRDIVDDVVLGLMTTWHRLHVCTVAHCPIVLQIGKAFFLSEGSCLAHPA